MGHRIVVIGASTGGVAALGRVVAGLPADLNASVFVVLHIGANPTRLPQLLDRVSALPVMHPHNGQRIERGKIYVAPPDLHMLIEPGHIQTLRGPKENHTRPAVDPMFRSAALAYGPEVIGVVLTGNLDNGSAGLLAIKDCGGVAVVQDPTDAASPSMPKSALTHVAVDHCCRAEEIGPLLVSLVADDVPVNESRSSTMGKALGRIPALEQQASILTDGMADLDLWNRLTTPSRFACPECQAPLGEIRDPRLLRFRCPLGHAYSGKTLLRAFADAGSAAMARTVAALCHEAALARRLADQAGGTESSRFLDDLARDRESDADVLQRILGTLSERIEPEDIPDSNVLYTHADFSTAQVPGARE